MFYFSNMWLNPVFQRRERSRENRGSQIHHGLHLQGVGGRTEGPGEKHADAWKDIEDVDAVMKSGHVLGTLKEIRAECNTTNKKKISVYMFNSSSFPSLGNRNISSNTIIESRPVVPLSSWHANPLTSPFPQVHLPPDEFILELLWHLSKKKEIAYMTM